LAPDIGVTDADPPPDFARAYARRAKDKGRTVKIPRRSIIDTLLAAVTGLFHGP
jgi:hypothetical protein